MLYLQKCWLNHVCEGEHFNLGKFSGQIHLWCGQRTTYTHSNRQLGSMLQDKVMVQMGEIFISAQMAQRCHDEQSQCHCCYPKPFLFLFQFCAPILIIFQATGLGEAPVPLFGYRQHERSSPRNLFPSALKNVCIYSDGSCPLASFTNLRISYSFRETQFLCTKLKMFC